MSLLPSVAVVQGASRGIGLGFVRHLLSKSPTSRVVATCRNPQSAGTGLEELQQKYSGRLEIVQLDVCKEDDIVAAAKLIKDKYEKINLLVNSSGILNPDGKGETSLKHVHQDALRKVFDTNALGPLLMMKHFAEVLSVSPKAVGVPPSIVANISAKVGSISDNRLGGWYAYRGSKAALNMFTKNAALELYGKKILVVSLHPGTVDTDFSRRYHNNVNHQILSVDECVENLLNILGSLTLQDSGNFFAYNGQELPW